MICHPLNTLCLACKPLGFSLQTIAGKIAWLQLLNKSRSKVLNGELYAQR